MRRLDPGGWLSGPTALMILLHTLTNL